MSRWDPPLWIDRLGGVSWRFLALVAAGAVVVAGILSFSSVILPIVLGLLFTCALQPLAEWLRGRGVSNVLAAVACLLVLSVALLGVVWLTIDAVVDQWPEITALLDEGRAVLTDTADDAGIGSDTAEDIAVDVTESVTSAVELLLRGVVTILPTVAGIVTAVLLSLLVMFFFVKDGGLIWRWIVARIDTTDGLVERIGGRVWHSLSGYILGQTAIAAADASLITLGALVLGVPNAAAIFIITFFGAYVPYIGATVAGFVAVLMAIGEGGLERGAAMLAVVIAVQLLEGNVLQPWIQGRAVRLHPLVIALSITAGGALAGFLGVFLAVPITAAGVVTLSELRAAGVIGDPRVSFDLPPSSADDG